ncbi:sigma-54-dependent Fis family transcriptional regulator [Halopseudomonas pelagia]|uniref:Sigma-54-dependent Fis family transcriptional regulator n=2 Tax=Halopseudomonas pelagia TaxID=553151 RepID=A0AA91Z6Z2_9GAMM|nr:sigma-54 dependent transcriptional regulator [Halopseudomonas pelagia]PCD00518.1 sigma-54-dependent Fis family transcriptional regulator [Halopseudomonas pelagia]QFY55221.1 sigma-54-dependent Fis family transcriptional regulator [Halopseudomonas pelagia]
MNSAGLLLVEDSQSTSMLYEIWLSVLGVPMTLVEDGAQALDWLENNTPSVVLLDLHLPDMAGLDILRSIRQRGLQCEVIVITADNSQRLAVQAMEEGAQDFLVKPVDADRLRVSVRNALRARKLESIASNLAATVNAPPPPGFIGSSIQMQSLYHTLRLIAHSDAPVFISGESGTGKELCASAIHQYGPRRNKPLVALNCAAIPSELVESQLFGHIKGAFTGAVASRTGLTEQAHGGTLFLDEVTELSLEVQSKLLRFLQTGEITPVGTSISKHLNCRIVCATNLDIRKRVEKGLFREDLFYRLHVVPLLIPPLRERGGDIVEIATALLLQFSTVEGKRFKGLSESARQLLQAYSWPGNVRELENTLRHAVVMHNGDWLEAAHIVLPKSRSVALSDQAPVDEQAAGILPLWQVERDAIARALAHCQGNVAQAAALLEVAPSTLYRRMQAKNA